VEGVSKVGGRKRERDPQGRVPFGGGETFFKMKSRNLEGPNSGARKMEKRGKQWVQRLRTFHLTLNHGGGNFKTELSLKKTNWERGGGKAPKGKARRKTAGQTPLPPKLHKAKVERIPSGETERSEINCILCA